MKLELNSTITVREALERYRTQVSILKKGYAQEVYRIRHIATSSLGEVAVGCVTSRHIASYRDERLSTINVRTNQPISNATVRLEMSLLSNFFDISRIEWGYCESNPVANVRKPKPPPGRDRRITPREERLILRYCHAHPNPEIKAMFILALETAMRQGELLGMRWENINLKARIVRLPETKNGSVRDVPLSLKARDVLVSLGQHTAGKVFRFTNSGFKSSWRFMIKRLGISDLHFHDCRHEATSRLFELGTMNALEVAAITGHKSMAMLKRYTHLSATTLVHKLEGQRNRAKAAVISHMVPYPAMVTERDGLVCVKLMDFDDLETTAPSLIEAANNARVLLMRTILNGIRYAQPIPNPDQFLDAVPESSLYMIDPLSSDVLLQKYSESSKPFQ